MECVTAHPERLEKLGSEHIADSVELGDFVIEPSDPGLIKLELAPAIGIVGAHRLDNLHHLGAPRKALRFQRLEGVVGRLRGCRSVFEYAVARAFGRNCRCRGATAAGCCGIGAADSAFVLLQLVQDFGDNVADCGFTQITHLKIPLVD